MPWRCPTQVVFERGAIASRLPSLARALGATAALVSDPGLQATPWPAAVAAALEAGGVKVVLSWSDVEANPRDTTVNRLGAAVKAAGAEFIVAVGGGSSIDAAKGAAIVATSGGDIRQYEGLEKYTCAPMPVLAVPTTCGTGSEVTWVSVVTQSDEKRKMSIYGPLLFPRVAIVDADVLKTLPANLVAYTGVDALTHALEAALCCDGVADPISDVLAEDATALLLGNLRAAVEGAGLLEETERLAETRDAGRERVFKASTLAGMAFGNADVGAVHCLSESLGGQFDVPHGLGNAVFLAATLRHHLAAEGRARPAAGAAAVALPRVRTRLARLARRCDSEGFLWPPLITPRSGDDDDAVCAAAFVAGIARLVDDLHIPKFSALGIDPAALSHIAALSVANGSNGSNPNGPLSHADFMAIMKAAG